LQSVFAQQKIENRRKRSDEKAPNIIIAHDGLGGMALQDAEGRC
jgi:hypothetical protein